MAEDHPAKSLTSSEFVNTMSHFHRAEIGRMAGWLAHAMEQKQTGRLIRPSAHYSGPDTRPADSVEGWNADWA